jgi:CBS domain-containing protein
MVKATELAQKISSVCSTAVGGLEKDMLCQSISTLMRHDPITVKDTAPLKDVVALLQQHKMGCVGIVDSADVLIGIFSERDFILKVVSNWPAAQDEPVSTYMTRQPVTESPTCTVAYALNLMSLGGFRHLPIVDGDGSPLAMISVKDILDSLVEKMMHALME